MSPKTIFQNTKSESISRTNPELDSKRIPNPTIGTVKMVEETLSKMSEYPTKNKLWRKLPRQVQYPAFKVILEYLEELNKIMYDDDGTIVLISVNSPQLEKLRASESLLDQ